MINSVCNKKKETKKRSLICMPMSHWANNEHLQINEDLSWQQENSAYIWLSEAMLHLKIDLLKQINELFTID
ncbi:hypothetical protein BpHYR1_035631 [Brachionus plicatilis]|uniref:Uncharacterized protein n=1 Tax=Brachionus plicatilis TaxID=10195 RepID=A0A3M7RQ34_BRAPC|nr:hypothetical protein BpHYR1_035631 [Brachionus plicatilis]